VTERALPSPGQPEEGREQLQRDIYAEVFDGMRRMTWSPESVNKQAERITDSILMHVDALAAAPAPPAEKAQDDTRVVELVARWRDFERCGNAEGTAWDDGYESALMRCATELEAVLKSAGQPEEGHANTQRRNVAATESARSNGSDSGGFDHEAARDREGGRQDLRDSALSRLTSQPEEGRERATHKPTCGKWAQTVLNGRQLMGDMRCTCGWLAAAPAPPADVAEKLRKLEFYEAALGQTLGALYERENALAAAPAALEWVRKVAAIPICSDAGESGRCCTDSGPYCGVHLFDDYLVEEARAVLASAATADRKDT
jgi:hypothetical protein